MPNYFMFGGGIGLALAIVLGLGAAFMEWREERERQEYRNQRPKRSPSPERRGITCKRCGLHIGDWQIKILPCKHVFHSICILKETHCPVVNCRRPFKSSPDKPRQRQTQAICAYCGEKLAGREIEKLPCSHVVHSECIPKNRDASPTCPFPGCGQSINISRPTSPSDEIKFASPPQWKASYIIRVCSSCDMQITGKEPAAQLSCSHVIHTDCLKMGTCPMPSCLYLASLTAQSQ